MHAPIRLVRGGWPTFIERRLSRFMRDDPSAIVSPDISPEAFRRIVSMVHVGDTIKITGTKRHQQADALLVENLDLASKTIVDLGASDGTTSIELVSKLDAFGAYVIADLYLYAAFLLYRGRLFMYDHSGTCVLVAGRHFVAWPAISRPVHAAYRLLIHAAEARRTDRSELLLLNPDVAALMRHDPRVSFRVHDVFQEWDEPKPDVMKVANLLRRLYFSDFDIKRALASLHASIRPGGHLLLVDNPRIANVAERAGLYRRSTDRFIEVARTDEEPEIADLVIAYRSGRADRP